MSFRTLLPGRSYILCQAALTVAVLLIWIAPLPKLRPNVQNVPFQAHLASLASNVGIVNMDELTRRPIFSQSRRPPAPIAVSAPTFTPAKPVPTTNGMVLLGILRTGTKTVALVTIPGKSWPVQVENGDMLGDWKIIGILNDRIVLRSGANNAELALAQPSSSATSLVSQSGVVGFGSVPTPPPMPFPTLNTP